jgi:predicted DNA-binding transcriptional regulator AlpA
MTGLSIDKRIAQIVAAAADNTKEVMTTAEVAQFLGVSEVWVIKKRATNDGPPFEMISPKCIRYSRTKLLKWLGERTRYYMKQQKTKTLRAS